MAQHQCKTSQLLGSLFRVAERFSASCVSSVSSVHYFYANVTLSVAIVAMVNETAVAGDVTTTNGSDDQRTRDSEQQYKGEQFNWDRNQQGMVLAAFYCGYGVTLVCIINT